LPRDEDDLIVAAKGSHFLGFDNVSGISDWLSDAICRLSTGGGQGKRRLYTDDEEVLFAGRRPVALNGIEDVVVRPDLVDRSLLITLEPIPESRRREERDIEEQFEREAPKIFAGLLDALSAALRNLPEIKIPNLPRMADFAMWAEAGIRSYEAAGTFISAYRSNLALSVSLIIEDSPVGNAVQRFMVDRAEWQGPASALLPQLTAIAGEPTNKERSWPKQANQLAGKLRRVAPALRKTGIHISFTRDGRARTRTIRIEARLEPDWTGETPFAPSAPSASTAKPNEINNPADEAADDERTMANPSIVRTTPLKSNTVDDADDADDVLHRKSGKADTNRDRGCAQCQGPVDGKERKFTVDGEHVWLHPQCYRYLISSKPAAADPWDGLELPDCLNRNLRHH
jgi:hypothetical protein